MQKFLLMIILMISLLSSACVRTSFENNKNNVMDKIYTQKLQVGKSIIYVEIANTDQSREQGLSGRDKLTDSQGMLFDFKNTGVTAPGFWMKDMKFNLDLIWIRENQIVGITPNVPHPEPPSN